MNRIASYLACFLLMLIIQTAYCEDGYELWLRYHSVSRPEIRKEYQQYLHSFFTDGKSATTDIIINELNRGIYGMTGDKVILQRDVSGASLIAIKGNHPLINTLKWKEKVKSLGRDGFLLSAQILNNQPVIIIAGNNDISLLYGTFHLLRLMQQEKSIVGLNIESKPAIANRILNHWDNLDRTVERGYAGFSLWDWHKLPDYVDPRYSDYARANASIGVNGTVLTNVNANALALTEPYLKKVRALADLFRPYGIKVYLTARFSAPIEIGGLTTADPLDATVQKWWNEKTAEIYKLIPDFGGFVVKANSEGQPGPQNYGRNHAEGANMLAKALQPFNGIVMWRAFVYSNEIATDRVKQAYQEFKPLDGKFDQNVLIQVKNGPLDFQPREPFHPLFGAMPKTPLMLEFQLTQEYLGFSTHLVYLAPLFEEVLKSDTRQKGIGSTVSKVADGTLHGHRISAIAGVANIGTDRNWCGHPFAQANWYAFGRMSWDYSLSSEKIAEEWIGQTFSTETTTINSIAKMMMASREIVVNYMTPLGLHHIMGWNHHYGPGPWIKDKQRADWTSVYYHKADKNGIGFDRTSTGSNALEQYHEDVAAPFRQSATCPEIYLLWFHHLPWSYVTKSGLDLWEELCYRYYSGAQDVKKLQKEWSALQGKIDQEQFQHVESLLAIQYSEACWWRNACLLYFSEVSGRSIPSHYEQPEKDLSYYESLEYPFAPGIKPKW